MPAHEKNHLALSKSFAAKVKENQRPKERQKERVSFSSAKSTIGFRTSLKACTAEILASPFAEVYHALQQNMVDKERSTLTGLGTDLRDMHPLVQKERGPARRKTHGLCLENKTHDPNYFKTKVAKLSFKCRRQSGFWCQNYTIGVQKTVHISR